MISETIENAIRTFDYCQAGFCGLHDLDEEPDTRWPAELAAYIIEALAPDMRSLLQQQAMQAIADFKMIQQMSAGQ